MEKGNVGILGHTLIQLAPAQVVIFEVGPAGIWASLGPATGPKRSCEREADHSAGSKPSRSNVQGPSGSRAISKGRS